MQINTDSYSITYYGFAIFIGIILYLFNPWYGISIWTVVAMGIFHEPVHWAAARLLGVPVISITNTRTEMNVEVPAVKRSGYVALAGFLFNLFMACLTCYAMTMYGAFIAGELWIGFIILTQFYYDNDVSDLKIFWRLVVKHEQ